VQVGSIARLFYQPFSTAPSREHTIPAPHYFSLCGL